MFKRMKLGTKLLLAFLAVGIIPFAVIGTFSLTKASSALSQSAFNQLTAVQAIKSKQVKDYFESAFVNIKALGRSDDVRQLFVKLCEYHIRTDVKA